MPVSAKEQQPTSTVFPLTNYCEGFWNFCFIRPNSTRDGTTRLVQTVPFGAWIRTEVLAIVTRDGDAAAPLSVMARFSHCGDDNPTGISDSKEVFRDTFTECSLDELKANHTNLFRSILTTATQSCDVNRFLPAPGFVPVQGGDAELLEAFRKNGLAVTAVA